MIQIKYTVKKMFRENIFNVGIFCRFKTFEITQVFADVFVQKKMKSCRRTKDEKTVKAPGNYRMMAVTGILHRLYANLVCSLIQNWSSQNSKDDTAKTAKRLRRQ